jgi:hypothetical protein
VRACVPEKIFPGATPPDPQGRRKGEEGEGMEGKGGQREGGEGRKGREGKEGKGIRVGREGVGPPPQCLTQIDAPDSQIMKMWPNHELRRSRRLE